MFLEGLEGEGDVSPFWMGSDFDYYRCPGFSSRSPLQSARTMIPRSWGFLPCVEKHEGTMRGVFVRTPLMNHSFQSSNLLEHMAVV